MNHYSFLIPEIILLVMGVLSFLYGFIKRDIKISWILGFISLAISAFIALISFNPNEFSTGLIKIDIYRQFLRMLVLLAGLIILSISYEELNRKSSKSAEYVFLLILAVFGMNMMILVNDLLILYLSLETFSLCLYILAAFYRNDKLSIEAGLKYFILGTVSSVLLLGSVVFFYALTGSTSYEAFKMVKTGNFTVLLSLIFLIASFAFKLSLAPFHAWAPDVYQGAPTPVTAFFSTAPKIAVFAALINVFLSMTERVRIEEIVIVVSILSMFLGNLLALRQTNLKRMFAYSSIAHAGYMFMAFLLPKESLLSSLIPYLFVYLFMNIGAFAFILSIKEGENISSYLGFGRKNPLLAFSIIIILFSLTGIPPTAGFIVKLNLFKNVLSYGYGGLVFFALLMSILSAFYYLRIVFYMYREHLSSEELSHRYSIIALLSAFLLSLSGIFPNMLLIF